MTNKEQYQENKEYYKQYRLDNKEKIKENRQTPKGKKMKTINKWNHRGIIDPDLGAVYDYYIKQTNCMICLKEFKNTKNSHLDHGKEVIDGSNIRYICCHNCNCHLLAEKYNI